VVRLVVTGGSLTRKPKGHLAVSWSRYLDKWVPKPNINFL